MSRNSMMVTNLSEAVTLEPLARDQRFTAIADGDLGRIANAWIAIEDGKILEIGTGHVPSQYKQLPSMDGTGCLALPGLIDAHTHALHAGIRSGEFCQRLNGATYQEIAANGGGIQSTVAATKKASDEDLRQALQMRLNTFARHGVTTVEVKSGYGLSVDEEIRHLRLIKEVSQSSAQTVVATCLALHAVPRNCSSARAWSDTCARELVPTVARESLAHAVDVFIEAGYFLPNDARPYVEAAKRCGLELRIHADEFSDTGGAAFAAAYGALSADHLQYAHRDGIAQMAKAGVCAMLLPGTSLYTSIPYADSTRFKDLGCAVGLATDFNPGSCPVDNLRLALTIGALHCKLTMAEAVAAVTWIPSKSLKLHKTKGALTVGRDADILLMPMPTVEDFVADLGRTPPRAVFARGVLISDQNKA